MPNFAMMFAIDWSEIPDGTIVAPMLQDGCVGYSKLADEAVHSDKIADGAVKADNIAIEAVTRTKLKLESASWNITIPADTTASYNMQTYAHMPGQGVSREVVKIWHEAAPAYENYVRIFAQNTDPSLEEYWTGEYLYHSDSEQEIGIHIGKNGKVVGVEIYEKEFGPGLKLWDQDRNEIPLDQYVITADDWPEIFENKICKKHAKDLFKMKKELKKRMKKRENHDTEKTD